jgi:hypothetical protein
MIPMPNSEPGSPIRSIRVLGCASPVLARNGHGAMSALSPLSGVKRKSDFWAVRSGFDPTETSAARLLFKEWRDQASKLEKI